VDESADGAEAATPNAVALDDSVVGWARSLPAPDGLALSGVDVSATRSTTTVSGSVRLRYDLPVADLAAAKAIYADPAHWTGSARPSDVLADTTDGWSVPFAVAGTTGRLSASTANLAGVAAVTVELALSP
jgi:hypothetical protein